MKELLTGFKRKLKKSPSALPKQKKKWPVKHLTIGLFSLLGLFIMIGLVGLFQGINVTGQLSGLKSTIQLVDDKATEKRIFAQDNPQLDVFLENFVQLYCTKSPDSDEMAKRKQALQAYWAKDISLPEETVKQTVRLKNSRLLTLEKDQGLAVALMKVTLQVSGKKEQEVKKEVTEKRAGKEEKKTIVEKETVPFEAEDTYILRIPYVQEDTAIRIMALPSIAPMTMTNDQVTGRTFQHLTELENMSEAETERLKTFVTEFFTKYSTSSAEDMRYMMTKPEGLKGLVTFVRLGEPFIAKKDGDHYVVGGTVFFLLPKLTLEQEESFELRIHNTDQGYVVDEYSHFPAKTTK
ncbi:conjugal transfer protein [Enterococcus sp. DIV1420a]|uniref:conjugal transfer protein n=1 Tax=Enterococcus sp. DIV1420a TaxID=2774672 RepID=UPI00128A2810|nr:hypothetical protein [Listeria monocytogenes]